MACLSSDLVPCPRRPGDAADASTPVLLDWAAPNLGAALVEEYAVYRLEYTGDFDAFQPPADLSEAATLVDVTDDGTSDYDYDAPAGKQLAYLVRARYYKTIGESFDEMDCEDEGGVVVFDGGACRFESAISNFATVETPAALPNLTIVGYEANYPYALNTYPGGTVTLSSWTVFNQGEGTASGPDSGPFSNRFYLSTDEVITAEDIPLGTNSNYPLAPDDSYDWLGPELEIPSTIDAGFYYIGILVDYPNQVAESDEGNNYVSEPIIIEDIEP